MTSTAMTRSTGHAPRTEDEEETAGGMTASTSTAFADEDNEKAAAAVKLQAVVKGYRERKAFKDIDTYVSAACDEEEQEQEQEQEDEDEDEARRRSSLSARELRNDNLEDRASLEMSRSFSACDLQQVKQRFRTIDAYMRKRIVKSAALIGKGITRTLSEQCLRGQRCVKANGGGGGDDDDNRRKKVSFLTSTGDLKRESLDIPSVRSIPLKKKHWLEAVDAKHRYGSNLAVYYEEWKEQKTMENFFRWLDYGSGKDIELESCPRKILEAEVIKYCNKKEREKYEVLIKDDGILVYKQTGSPVHTMDSSVCVLGRCQIQGTGDAAKNSKSNHASAADTHDPDDADNIRQNDTWIFVCSPEGKIYVGKKRLNPPPRFQHSSFLSGGAALAAGQMDVACGKVIEIRAFSGHYRPKRENLLAFLQLLHDEGVDTKQVRFKQFKNK